MNPAKKMANVSATFIRFLEIQVISNASLKYSS